MSSLFWNATQHWSVVSYWCFKTTYTIFKGQRVQEKSRAQLSRQLCSMRCGYWFSENKTLANRISGAWWIWNGAGEEESRDAYGVLWGRAVPEMWAYHQVHKGETYENHTSVSSEANTEFLHILLYPHEQTKDDQVIAWPTLIWNEIYVSHSHKHHKTLCKNVIWIFWLKPTVKCGGVWRSLGTTDFRSDNSAFDTRPYLYVDSSADRQTVTSTYDKTLGTWIIQVPLFSPHKWFWPNIQQQIH
jgi:hypothetical protein